MLFHSSAFIRALNLTCLSLALPVCAQTASTAPKAASDASAIERSQRQTDNVYKWIRYFANRPQKSDAIKPRAKADVVATPPADKKPDPKKPETVAGGAPEVAPAPTATADAQLPPTTKTVPVAANETVAAVAEPEVVADAMQPLVPISVVEPTIPRELSHESLNTIVKLSFTVQADGRVAKPLVVSGNNRRLNKSAIDAITQWRFEPIQSERLAQIEFQFTQN